MGQPTFMEKQRRILIVDDNEAIHMDFKNILSSNVPSKATGIQELEDDLFEEEDSENTDNLANMFHYSIDDAFQGEEAIAMTDAAVAEGHPYALIFMDVRMPPGIDGIQTIKQIWKKHPNTEMVICTAYSDYSWDQMIQMFGQTHHLLFLKKPFDNVAVNQLASSLVAKWELNSENERDLGGIPNNGIIYDNQSSVKITDPQLVAIANRLEILQQKINAGGNIDESDEEIIERQIEQLIAEQIKSKNSYVEKPHESDPLETEKLRSELAAAFSQAFKLNK